MVVTELLRRTSSHAFQRHRADDDQAIADLLSSSFKTAESHRNQTMSKLDMHDATAASCATPSGVAWSSSRVKQRARRACTEYRPGRHPCYPAFDSAGAHDLNSFGSIW